MENFDEEIKKGVKAVDNTELLLNLLKTYNGINLTLKTALKMIKNNEIGDIDLYGEIDNFIEDQAYNYYYYEDSINSLLKNFNNNDYLELEDARFGCGTKEILFLLKNNYILKFQFYSEDFLHSAQLLKINDCKGRIYDIKFLKNNSYYRGYEYLENDKAFGLSDINNTVINRRSTVKGIITCDGVLNDELREYAGKNVHSFINEQSIYDIYDKVLDARNKNVKKLRPKIINKKI